MNYTHDIFLTKKEDSNLNSYFVSDDLEKPIEYLKNFNQINIFVGANNSGKSRFMRELMTFESIRGINELAVTEKILNEYNQVVLDFDFIQEMTYLSSSTINEFSKLYKRNAELKQGEILLFKELNIQEELNNNFEGVKTNIDMLEKIDLFFLTLKSRINTLISDLGIKSHSRHYYLKRTDHIVKIKKHLTDLHKSIENRLLINGKKIYIPTLRTAHSLFKEIIPEQENLIIDLDGNSSKNDKKRNFKKIKDDIFLDTVQKNFPKLDIVSSHQRKRNEDERFQKGAFDVATGDIEVFTGINLYNEIVNIRNSKKEKREQFHEFEKFLAENFFEGKDFELLAEFNIYRKDAQIENEDLIQVYIEDKSRELYNLGDGVQALIILMYKVFLANKDSIIYIDEPEINLHPGYQRLFLEQITNNPELIKKNLTYVIVTHSNHFLDLTLEKDNVSIYSFSALPKEENEEDKFMIRNVNAGDNQLLRDLGVNNSSVFLANSSIWVEGISDRNFIKAFLEAYCKTDKKKAMPREDIDFAFFEYAGSNLTHYDYRGNTSEGKEVKHLINSYALNNRIFLLSDLDEGQETKHNTLEEIAKETKNFSYKTTKPYREIENLLPNKVWEKALIEFWNKNKISDEESIQKAQDEINVSLVQTKSKAYLKKYIGEFLNALSLDGLNQIWEKDKNGNHKTFKQKARLSEIVLKKVRKGEIKWDDFAKNGTIKELTEAIYNFIKNEN